jgi:hypothetical protein
MKSLKWPALIVGFAVLMIGTQNGGQKPANQQAPVDSACADDLAHHQRDR